MKGWPGGDRYEVKKTSPQGQIRLMNNRGSTLRLPRANEARKVFWVVRGSKQERKAFEGVKFHP